MYTKVFAWLRRGNRNRRMAKVIGISLGLYVLLNFLSQSFRLAEGLLSLGLYAGLILWTRIQDRTFLRTAGLSEIDDMDERQFTARMCSHFRTLGWKAREANRPEFGVQLMLVDPLGHKFAALLAPTKDSVVLSSVQAAIAAIQFYGADNAMIVTNRRLAPAALELARSNGVILWQRPQLAESLASVTAEGQGPARHTPQSQERQRPQSRAQEPADPSPVSDLTQEPHAP